MYVFLFHSLFNNIIIICDKLLLNMFEERNIIIEGSIKVTENKGIRVSLINYMK